MTPIVPPVTSKGRKRNRLSIWLYLDKVPEPQLRMLEYIPVKTVDEKINYVNQSLIGLILLKSKAKISIEQTEGNTFYQDMNRNYYKMRALRLWKLSEFLKARQRICITILNQILAFFLFRYWVQNVEMKAITKTV